MRTNRCSIFSILLLMGVCGGQLMIESTLAQKTDSPKPEARVDESGQVEDWYYRSPGEVVTKKSIAQMKAEARGQQRMNRLASQRWYGYSNARPTVAAIPFTAMYRSAWQRPGGWPYHWNRSPVVIVK